MRTWLSIATVVVAAAAAAFLAPSGGSTGVKVVEVALTSAGASPSTVRMYVGTELVNFVNEDSVSHTVVFADGHCSLDIPPGSPPTNWGDCRGRHGQWPFYAGSYAYTVDGTSPGEIDVMGFPRSVSLTAHTHAVRLGGKLTLHGHLTIRGPHGIDAPCAVGPRSPVIRVLARHDRRHPFERIAMFVRPYGSVKVVKHSCTYRWQLEVRPGLRTIYIADSTFARRWWAPATSRPFAVRVR